MDLDLQNASGALDWSGSIRIKIQRTTTRKGGSGLNRPGLLAYIKGLRTGSPHFFPTFLSLLLFFTGRSLLTLNPNSFNPPRNAWFMAQKLCLIVLITNLLLEFSCIDLIDVDLEFSFADFERFWFSFWFKSFSKWFCMLIRWFTTVVTGCKSLNLSRFLENFRVSWFRTKTLRIPYGFTSVWISLLFMSRKR